MPPKTNNHGERLAVLEGRVEMHDTLLHDIRGDMHELVNGQKAAIKTAIGILIAITGWLAIQVYNNVTREDREVRIAHAAASAVVQQTQR